MSGVCPQCGSSHLVEDDLYSQKQLVCEECGSLVSEGELTTTYTEERQGQVVSYDSVTEGIKKPCPNQLRGVVRVRALCRILRFPSHMEECVVDLFQRAYAHPRFLHCRLLKKAGLGACCVLSVSRQNGWPLPLTTVCSLAEADPDLTGGLLQQLNQALDINISTVSITNMLESYCQGFKLSSGDVGQQFAEASQRLVQRSADMLQLATDTWLLTGRHPLPLLMACVYVAWQSLNPPARMKCTLNKFCQIARQSREARSASKNTASRRVSELRAVLCRLGRELPWLRGDAVEPGTVAKLVDDILEHRVALLLKARASHEEALERELSVEGDESCPQPDDSSLALSGTERNRDCPSPNSSSPAHEQKGRESSPPAGEVHWGKRHLFLPPCVRNGKRPRTEPDPEQPSVTGDEEISDSEIESYIRSPEEVRIHLEVQKKLQEGS